MWNGFGHLLEHLKNFDRYTTGWKFWISLFLMFWLKQKISGNWIDRFYGQIREFFWFCIWILRVSGITVASPSSSQGKMTVSLRNTRRQTQSVKMNGALRAIAPRQIPVYLSVTGKEERYPPSRAPLPLLANSCWSLSLLGDYLPPFRSHISKECPRYLPGGAEAAKAGEA